MKNESITTLSLVAVLFVVCLLLPGTVWGGDGTLLWFPVVSQFLKGYESYESSLVFSGQNLLGIYGELPFWNVFKVLGISTIKTLNLTYFFWVFLSYPLLIEILRGLKSKLTSCDLIVLFFYTCFSAIVFNRVYAGHFNLLFGLFPIIVMMVLVFNTSKRVLGLCFLGLWSAFSIQGYQILIYHVFYLPFAFFFVQKYQTSNHKRYFLITFAVTLVAFAFSWKGFFAMFSHATTSTTARSLSDNVVYSYTVSQVGDIFNLIFTTPMRLTLNRGGGFYHELNYPFLPALAYLAYKLEDNKMRLALVLTFLSLFLFSMGVFPFHFLAELPFVKSFRVPQRSLMLLGFIAPLMAWGISQLNFRKKEFALFIGYFFFVFFVPYLEILVILVLASFPLWRNKTDFLSQFDQKAALALLVALPICLSPFKLDRIFSTNGFYARAIAAISLVEEKVTKEEKTKYRYHFESRNPLIMTSAANFVGFKTVEGYGHPPGEFLERYFRVTGKKLPPLTNQFFFPFDKEVKEKLYDEFGIDRVVSFNQDGTLHIKKWPQE